jgi:hypothetical protein
MIVKKRTEKQKKQKKQTKQNCANVPAKCSSQLGSTRAASTEMTRLGPFFLLQQKHKLIVTHKDQGLVKVVKVVLEIVAGLS